MAKLAVPTVHRNGSSRRDLIDQHLEAIRAIDAALVKLGTGATITCRVHAHR
jgi:hypothetical protein